MPDVKLLIRNFENEIKKNIHHLAKKQSKSIGESNSQIPLVFLHSEHKDQPEEKLKTLSYHQNLFKNSHFLKKSGLSEIWSQISSFEETKKPAYKTCYVYPV